MAYHFREYGDLVFFKSKEMPDYYLLYAGRLSEYPDIMAQKFNHTGLPNSGYPYAATDYAYSINAYEPHYFMDYIVEHIATNHIPHPKINADDRRAWYELKTYEPEKWVKEYDDFRNAKNEENRKMMQQQPRQLTLF